MTDLKELTGIDEEVLAKLKEMGVEDADSLKERIEEEGAEKLAEALGIEAGTVASWSEDLQESEEKEGEQEEAAPPEKTEAAEEEKEGEYVVKKKPVLSAEVSAALALRSEIASRRPKFLRAEYFKAQRLGLKWRKPRGKQGKMRLFTYYRPKSVSIGYGSPSSARGLHPSGFAEKLVYNVSQLEGVDPKTTAVRIAHTVGSRKRQDIVAEAEKLDIRVLNG